MIKVIKTIKEICNAYKNFYVENLHTNCGDKTTRSKTSNLN